MARRQHVARRRWLLVHVLVGAGRGRRRTCWSAPPVAGRTRDRRRGGAHPVPLRRWTPQPRRRHDARCLEGPGRRDAAPGREEGYRTRSNGRRSSPGRRRARCAPLAGDEVWLVANEAGVDHVERWSVDGDARGSFDEFGPIAVIDLAVDEGTGDVFASSSDSIRRPRCGRATPDQRSSPSFGVATHAREPTALTVSQVSTRRSTARRSGCS